MHKLFGFYFIFKALKINLTYIKCKNSIVPTMLSIVKILDETMFKDMLNIEVVYVTIGNPASGLAL